MLGDRAGAVAATTITTTIIIATITITTTITTIAAVTIFVYALHDVCNIRHRGRCRT